MAAAMGLAQARAVFDPRLAEITQVADKGREAASDLLKAALAARQTWARLTDVAPSSKDPSEINAKAIMAKKAEKAADSANALYFDAQGASVALSFSVLQYKVGQLLPGPGTMKFSTLEKEATRVKELTEAAKKETQQTLTAAGVNDQDNDEMDTSEMC